MFRKLEASVNARDPLLTREQTWWKTLRAIGKEVGLVRLPPGQDLAADLVTADRSSRRAAGQRRGRRGHGRTRLTDDRGSALIETVGLLPSVFLVVAFCWQVAIVGVTFVWSGYAAQAASHAVQLGADPGPAARDRVPGYFRDGMQVAGPAAANDDRVRVTMRVPLFAPGYLDSPWTITTDRRVVTEPAARGGAGG
jgi:pilus assembly protein CpaE